jgi:hypothetical protein
MSKEKNIPCKECAKHNKCLVYYWIMQKETNTELEMPKIYKMERFTVCEEFHLTNINE